MARRAQVQPGLAHHAFEPGDIRRQHLPSECGQPVIAPPRIVVSRQAPARVFHRPLLQELVEIVVERARAELILPFGLPCHLLHDAVAVTVLACQGEQDVQGRRGERQVQTQVFGHRRIPLYRNPSEMSRWGML